MFSPIQKEKQPKESGCLLAGTQDRDKLEPKLVCPNNDFLAMFTDRTKLQVLKNNNKAYLYGILQIWCFGILAEHLSMYLPIYHLQLHQIK